jgi:hypothetical protein
MIVSTTTSNNTFCSDLAWKAIQGLEEQQRKSPIYYNYQYHFSQRTTQKFSRENREILVARSGSERTTCGRILSAFERFFGGRGCNSTPPRLFHFYEYCYYQEVAFAFRT